MAQVYPGCGVDLNFPWNLAISFGTAFDALRTCDLVTTNEMLNCYAILPITCRNAKNGIFLKVVEVYIP